MDVFFAKYWLPILIVIIILYALSWPEGKRHYERQKRLDEYFAKKKHKKK